MNFLRLPILLPLMAILVASVSSAQDNQFTVFKAANVDASVANEQRCAPICYDLVTEGVKALKAINRTFLQSIALPDASLSPLFTECRIHGLTDVDLDSYECLSDGNAFDHKIGARFANVTFVCRAHLHTDVSKMASALGRQDQVDETACGSGASRYPTDSIAYDKVDCPDDGKGGGADDKEASRDMTASLGVVTVSGSVRGEKKGRSAILVEMSAAIGNDDQDTLIHFDDDGDRSFDGSAACVKANRRNVVRRLLKSVAAILFPCVSGVDTTGDNVKHIAYSAATCLDMS